MPAVVEPSKAAPVPGTEQEVDPELSPAESELQIAGTLPGGQITEDGVEVVVGDGVCLTPIGESSSASDAVLVGDEAAFYANVAQDTDLAIRPTATGATMIGQIRSPEADHELGWEVSLQEGQELVELANGAVAVTEPAAVQDLERPNDSNVESTSKTNEAAVSGPAGLDIEDLLTDAGAQLVQGSWRLESAQEESVDEVIAVIAPPLVRDSANQVVPAFLEVAENKIFINIWEPEEEEGEENWDYPFISLAELSTGASISGIDDPPRCISRARKPYMRKYKGVLSFRESWHLLFGAAMRCKEVQYMKITVTLQRKFSALGVTVWNQIQGQQFEQGEDGGLAWRNGGGLCEATPNYSEFRTQIQGQAINHVHPVCLIKEFGQCKLNANDTSSTGRYRCAFSG
jgi:hypothetical protein